MVDCQLGFMLIDWLLTFRLDGGCCIKGLLDLSTGFRVTVDWLVGFRLLWLLFACFGVGLIVVW